MTISFIHRKLVTCALLIAATIGLPVHADDTDLFNPPAAYSPAAIPNILIVLHNPTNWNNQSQHFPSGLSVGEQEAASLRDLVLSLNSPVNLGVVMHGSDGGFVRLGLREVGNTTVSNLAARAKVAALFDAMSNNIRNETNVTPNAANSAGALYEVLLYLQGGTSRTQDSSKDYAANSFAGSGSSIGFADGFAYATGLASSQFTPPASASGCGKTYIVFMAANQTQYFAQPGSSHPSTSIVPLSAGVGLPGMEVAWTNYLYKNRNIVTYTIDSYYAKQDAGMSNGLKKMAEAGGGQAYTATSQSQISAALSDIFKNIQAVNSVFASSSLPVSVNVRGTYLNQVYMGVFRPDSLGNPNWAGNLKQYKLGVDTTANPPALFLADANGARAENTSSGFTKPGAVSFWSAVSSFWNALFYPDVQGSGGVSDSPDGDLVEKGGSGQSIRTTNATDVSTRKVYTCTTGCVSGSLLSATPFATSNASITNAALGATSTADAGSIINWIRGANTTADDNPSGLTTSIRGYAHGDVLHSRPAILNYGGTNNLMVFYGANDGLIHAVRGGQDTTVSGTHSVADGTEMWSMVLPEHFSKLKNLRDHAPKTSSLTPHAKPYFADGSFSLYTTPSADGIVNAGRGDKAYLYITMRRGGNFIYALDVTDPVAPKLLWKKSASDTGFGEMGQSWSEIKVTKIKGAANPVLFMGLGYDASANDVQPATVATKGRGVIAIDGVTGSPLWQAGPAPAGAAVNATVAGMTYSIAANLSAFDTDADGYVDRIYAADTGGNIWRINIDDGTSTSPSTGWTVNRLATLGGVGTNARKFLFSPDLVYSSANAAFDAVMIGSGDRENPFDTTIQNQFYMIKDLHAKSAVRSTVTQTDMFDATSAVAAPDVANGWYINLSTGEKVVGSSATLNGTVFFGTNLPQAAVAGTCAPNLGEARLYSINYITSNATVDNTANGAITLADRFKVRQGGGYPPSPVLVSVQILGKTYQAAISGAQVLSAPGISINKRTKTFWYRVFD